MSKQLEVGAAHHTDPHLFRSYSEITGGHGGAHADTFICSLKPSSSQDVLFKRSRSHAGMETMFSQLNPLKDSF